MGNLFDGLRDVAHNVVVTAMGYSATWTPSNGAPAQTGAVLFSQPTAKDDAGNDDFDIVTTRCEFLYSVFPGLFESVQGGVSELINVNGASYYAYKADRKFDGQTVILLLQPKP